MIIKQHGRTIDVETEPGVFTEFIITLPRGDGAAECQGAFARANSSQSHHAPGLA
jgi:hypothetical protein